MFHGEVAEEVVCEVIGVPARVRGTHGADDLLRAGGLPVLLGHVVPQLGLGEPELSTQRAREGQRGLHTVTLTTIVQV